MQHAQKSQEEKAMRFTYRTMLETGTYDNTFVQTVEMTKDFFDTKECHVVNLYPDCVFERFEGFGGAVTEAAAYNYSLMNEAQKKQLIHTYFSPDEMNYRLVRVHMDSCDFCLSQYEAVSDPEDAELKTFSFERTERYILPMLRDIQAERRGDLQLMLSPWSPPAFMKTNGQRSFGGRLKLEYRAMWAKILCRYVKEFQMRGFSVQRLSIQNEANAAQTWDSCLYTAEDEKIFLRDFLRPELQRQGLGEVEIFIWDHNKERIFERVRDTMDDSTRDMVTGAAFHWYTGDHFDNLELVKRLYPNMKLILSESCLEYRIVDNIEAASQRLCHEYVQDLNHGVQAIYDWNLLLNEQGGPNYVGNFCHAAFLYDTQTGELLPQKTLSTLSALSRAVKPGSQRILSSGFSDDLDVAAFRTGKSEVTALVLNKSEKLTPINLRMSGKGGSALLPPKTLGVFVVEE